MEVDTDAQQPMETKKQPKFRRELFARSADRSTVEDMADLVVHRYKIELSPSSSMVSTVLQWHSTWIHAILVLWWLSGWLVQLPIALKSHLEWSFPWRIWKCQCRTTSSTNRWQLTPLTTCRWTLTACRLVMSARAHMSATQRPPQPLARQLTHHRRAGQSASSALGLYRQWSVHYPQTLPRTRWVNVIQWTGNIDGIGLHCHCRVKNS